MDTLDNLLNRYFEGETSAEEERRLRELFAFGDVPPAWEVYRPLFAYWDEARALHEQTAAESFSVAEETEGIPDPDALLRAMDEPNEKQERPDHADTREEASPFDEPGAGNGLNPAKSRRKEKENRRRLFYQIAGIAASVLLVSGIYRLLYPLDPCFCSDNYVVINGRCYTDIHKVRSFAWEALQEVATPADEYFPISEETLSDREVIDDQLKELSSLFNEE